MKKMLLVSLILAVGCSLAPTYEEVFAPALAPSTLVPIAKGSDGSIIYVDTADATFDGDERVVWVEQVIDGDRIRAHTTFRCSSKTIKIGKVILRGKNGKVIEVNPPQSFTKLEEADALIGDTEIAYRRVCSS